MKQSKTLLLAVIGLTVLPAIAMAQPPGGRGRGGDRQGGRGFGPPPNPVVEALDADGDHELSKEEIAAAVAVLKTLDRNKDGRLSEDELDPIRRRGGRGGPGRGPGGPGGGPDGGPGGQPGGEAGEFAERILRFDENNDGKIAKDELPERMQSVLGRLDTNKDGMLDKTELEQSNQRFGPGEDRGGRGRGGPDGRGFGGPPSPEMFVQRAFEFDEDKDGKLDKQEVAKLAEQMGRDFGRGRGGRGGRGGGEDRPQRPARPESN